MAASSSRGAPQPAASARSELPAEPREVPASEAVEFTVGSFNFGYEQAMMTGAKNLQRHCTKFARLCAKIVEEGHCDLLFGSEVGGFR